MRAVRLTFDVEPERPHLAGAHAGACPGHSQSFVAPIRGPVLGCELDRDNSGGQARCVTWNRTAVCRGADPPRGGASPGGLTVYRDAKVAKMGIAPRYLLHNEAGK